MSSIIPLPSRSSHWRWVSSRRAAVGGGVLAAVLGVSAMSAGATTTQHAKPPSGTSTGGRPPAGAAKPAAAGQVTALSGDDITIQDQSKTAHTVTYSASTTFTTRTGSSSASALKVGDFIAVQGTTNGDSVTATSIMIGTGPPGKMGHGPGGKPGAHRPSGQDGPPPQGTPPSA